jgi:transposase IS66 family protein
MSRLSPRTDLPVLPLADACDPGAVPGAGDPPTEVRVPGPRAGGGSGTGPERLIKGGLPTEAIVASVLVSKYAWHLPLYRQSQMRAAQGLDIKRSVLAFWVGYAANELRPVYARLSRTHPDVRQDRGRRDEGASARSRPRPGQGRLFLGGRP